MIHLLRLYSSKLIHYDLILHYRLILPMVSNKPVSVEKSVSSLRSAKSYIVLIPEDFIYREVINLKIKTVVVEMNIEIFPLNFI